MSPAVVAAGAVVWKLVDGKVRVLLVHRTQHKDVTIPKGKVDPGETLPHTAVREIAEETGFDVELGAPLGTVEYRLPNGRQKIVHYWSAEVDPGAAERHSYEANGEIFALEWLPLSKAAKHLTYPHDAEVLERFAAQVEAGAARTFSLIVLRHGKAMPHEQWDGPDSTRPLLHHGLEQSVSVAGGIAAYGPEKLLSSPAVRCLSTIGPTAALTGLDIKASESISQDSYASDAARVEAVGQAPRQGPQHRAVLARPGDPPDHRRGGIPRARDGRWGPAAQRGPRDGRVHRHALHRGRRRPATRGRRNARARHRLNAPGRRSGALAIGAR